MSIEFTCPSCLARLRLRDEYAGECGRCPHCKGTIIVPDAGHSLGAEAPPPGQQDSLASASGQLGMLGLVEVRGGRIKFLCASCSTKMSAAVGAAGRGVTCPACQTRQIIPAVVASEIAAAAPHAAPTTTVPTIDLTDPGRRGEPAGELIDALANITRNQPVTRPIAPLRTANTPLAIRFRRRGKTAIYIAAVISGGVLILGVLFLPALLRDRRLPNNRDQADAAPQTIAANEARSAPASVSTATPTVPTATPTVPTATPTVPTATPIVPTAVPPPPGAERAPVATQRPGVMPAPVQIPPRLAAGPVQVPKTALPTEIPPLDAAPDAHDPFEMPAEEASAPQVPEATPRERILTAIADLESGDRSRARQAAEALQNLAPDEQRTQVSPLLNELLKDNAKLMRLAAVRALVYWGTPESTAGLAQALKDPDIFIRRAAFEALGNLHEPRGATEVARYLATADGNEAAASLQAMGSAAEDAVLRQLDRADDRLERECCRVLATIGTEKSLLPLKMLIKDKGVGVRAAAEQATAAIKDRAAQGTRAEPAGPTRKEPTQLKRRPSE